MRALLIILVALCLVLPAAAQTTDEGQTLALERGVNDARQGYGLPARTPSGKIRSVARVWNVLPVTVWDTEGTSLSVSLARSLRVAQFNTYEVYYSLYAKPGYHEAAEIVASWQADAIINYWIFRTPAYTSQGCAWWYEDNTTWGMCIYSSEWGAVEATLTPAPLPMPLMLTPRPLVTSTPTRGWWR